MIVTRSKKRKRGTDIVVRSTAAPGANSVYIPTYLSKESRKKKQSSSSSAALADSTNNQHKPNLATKKDQRKPTPDNLANIEPALVKPIPQVELAGFDHADRTKPQAAAEYASDLFNYQREVERRYAPSATYMNRQADINERMRAILIDWLIEVHLKFKLEMETLYLTVHLIDRFLQMKPVRRQKLQLVGVCAMLIASKFEEIYAPEIRDFVYISDNAYTNEEVLAMENLMLHSFQFRISTPSILSFLNRYLKIVGKDGNSTVALLSRYFAESMLQEYTMLRYPASVVAASSLALARKTLGKQCWNAKLQEHGDYTEQDLTACMADMIELMKPENGSGRKSNLKAVQKKFTSVDFGEVALLRLPVSL